MAHRIITLTTDFGLADAYAGVMKGVILGIAPGVTLVDITHDVPPQDVLSGALMLAAAWPYFPPNTIHLAVVDPGVGTQRRPIAVQTPTGTFVGPDNGLSALALAEAGAIDGATGRAFAGGAVQLTECRFWLSSVSKTFHGRDIFAPVAAHLASGTPIEALGRSIACLVPVRMPVPVVENGTVRGVVVAFDHFGNAVSNIPSSQVDGESEVDVEGRSLGRPAASYQDAPLVAIVGSMNRLEIAVRNGSARAELGLEIGDEVRVRRQGT